MSLRTLFKSITGKKTKTPVFQVRTGNPRFTYSIKTSDKSNLQNNKSEQQVFVTDKINTEITEASQPESIENISNKDNSNSNNKNDFLIIFSKSNKSIKGKKNKSILEIGLEENIDLKYSCTIGGCGSCKIKLLKGKVDMKSPNCLSNAEQEKGYILTCIAYTNEEIVLET